MLLRTVRAARPRSGPGPMSCLAVDAGSAHNVEERHAVTVGIGLEDLIVNGDPDALEGVDDRLGKVTVNFEHSVNTLLGRCSLGQGVDLDDHDPGARLIGIADPIGEPGRREVSSSQPPETDQLSDAVAAVLDLVAVGVLEHVGPPAERLVATRPDMSRAGNREALAAGGVGSDVLTSGDRGPVCDLDEIPANDLPTRVVSDGAGRGQQGTEQ